MLQTLKQIGDYVSEKKFKTKNRNIRARDKIAIVSVSAGKLQVHEILEFEEDKTYDYLFEYTGKNSVTGTTGILGISPFFLEKSKLTEDKIRKSGEYAKVYRERILDDDMINDFLGCLISILTLDEFKTLSVKWIYFKEVNNLPTEKVHKEFIKLRKTAKKNKSVDAIDGICDMCGEKSKIDIPRLPFFTLDIANYNFNLSSNDLNNSRLKICNNCEPRIVLGWEYISSLYKGRSFLLIPKLRDYTDTSALGQFIQLANNELSNFEKLNNVLRVKNIDERIELFFIVIKNIKQKVVIKKTVPNYKTFSIQFQEEKLVEGGEFNYVDWEAKYIVTASITSYFDLEKLLKFFFVYDKNQPLGEFFHFYQMYNNGVPENKGFNMDSNFKARLYLYRDSLFSFIYQIDIHSLDRKTLDDICLNYLRYEIRKSSEFGEEKIPFKIMEALNYYYFLKNKIVGDVKMKEQINNIKAELDRFDDENNIETAKCRIQEIIDKDERIVYYFIGQFIRKIDNSRYNSNKNKIFDSFIQSINRKNIKQRFAEDILQRQNFYIEKLNPKAKFVFEIFSSNLDQLFEDRPYEEVLIYLITGYYSRDLLKSSKIEETENASN